GAGASTRFGRGVARAGAGLLAGYHHQRTARAVLPHRQFLARQTPGKLGQRPGTSAQLLGTGLPRPGAKGCGRGLAWLRLPLANHPRTETITVETALGSE